MSDIDQLAKSVIMGSAMLGLAINWSTREALRAAVQDFWVGGDRALTIGEQSAILNRNGALAPVKDLDRRQGELPDAVTRATQIKAIARERLGFGLMDWTGVGEDLLIQGG